MYQNLISTLKKISSHKLPITAIPLPARHIMMAFLVNNTCPNCSLLFKVASTVLGVDYGFLGFTFKVQTDVSKAPKILKYTFEFCYKLTV